MREEILKITFNICGLICHFLSVVRCLLVKQGKWHIAVYVCILNLYDRDGLTNSVGSRKYKKYIIYEPESQAEQITNNNDKNEINKT